jgi:hypothetical protein
MATTWPISERRLSTKLWCLDVSETYWPFRLVILPWNLSIGMVPGFLFYIYMHVIFHVHYTILVVTVVNVKARRRN